MSISVIWTLFIIFVIVCVLLAHMFLGASRQHAYRKAFFLKGAAGLCFIAAGALAASICHDGRFAAFTTGGLILGLAGDQLLALRFIYTKKPQMLFAAGGGAFAAGHILYLFALTHKGSILPAAAVPAAAAGIAASAVYAKIMKNNSGSMKVLLGGYIVLLSAVNACAWGAAAGCASPGLLIFATGTLLFLISDNILFSYCFGPRSTFPMYRAVHGTYYAAQLCIGAGLGMLS